MVLGGLVLAPLGGLRTYYDEAVADEQRADGLLRVPRAVFDERRYDEVVLLDERLAHLRLGAGGSALEALRYLLDGERRADAHDDRGRRDACRRGGGRAGADRAGPW